MNIVPFPNNRDLKIVGSTNDGVTIYLHPNGYIGSWLTLQELIK